MRTVLGNLENHRQNHHSVSWCAIKPNGEYFSSGNWSVYHDTNDDYQKVAEDFAAELVACGYTEVLVSINGWYGTIEASCDLRSAYDPNGPTREPLKFSNSAY